MLSYNLGVQNDQAHKIVNKGDLYQRLTDDIRRTFTNEHNITIMLISEFGNMWNVIDYELKSHGCSAMASTEGVFTTILHELKLDYIKVYANAPYAALIDSRVWFVTERRVVNNLCAVKKLFAQHLIVTHMNTNLSVRVWNSHIPTSIAKKRNQQQTLKQQCIENMSKKCRGDDRSTPMAWVIAGDMNTDPGNLIHFCDPCIQPDTPCMSKSQWDPDHKRPAQISDIAVSQGIALETVQSFVGWHAGGGHMQARAACASDVHDAVVVKGDLTPDTMLGHDSSGIHPAAASTADVEASGGVHPNANPTAPPTEYSVDVLTSSGESAQTKDITGHTHPVSASPEQVDPSASCCATATMPSTRKQCYVCGVNTSSPVRLDAYGLAKGPPCPHVACGSLECHGRLHNLWLEECQELRLPRHRQSEVQSCAAASSTDISGSAWATSFDAVYLATGDRDERNVHDNVVHDTRPVHDSSGVHPSADSPDQNQAASPIESASAPIYDSTGQRKSATAKYLAACAISGGAHSTGNPTASASTSSESASINDSANQRTGVADPYLAACAGAGGMQASVGIHHTGNPTASTSANDSTDQIPNITDPYLTACASTGGSTHTRSQPLSSTQLHKAWHHKVHSQSTPQLHKAWHHSSHRIETHDRTNRIESTATPAASQKPSNVMPSESSSLQSIGPPPGFGFLNKISDIAQGVDAAEPASPFWFDPKLTEIAQGTNPEPPSPCWYDHAWGTPVVDERQTACQSMLKTLYLNGSNSRGQAQIIKSMQQPILIRIKYISTKAACTSTASGAREYTDAEWTTWWDWYAHNPLPAADMEEVVRQWQDEFEPKDSTKKQITSWTTENTRKTRKQAHNLRRGAFKAMQHQECNHMRQLAMMFLRFPASQCDQLVSAWTAYMTTPEYQREVNRSSKVDPNNVQAMADREAQRGKTAQMHRLRKDYRRMCGLHKRNREGPHRAMEKHKPADRRLWEDFCSGDMVCQMNAATLEHGYGTLHHKESDGTLSRQIIGSNKQIATESLQQLNHSRNWNSPHWKWMQ